MILALPCNRDIIPSQPDERFLSVDVQDTYTCDMIVGITGQYIKTVWIVFLIQPGNHNI